MEKRIIELYRRKFDDIRHEADGIEYWYARELMKLLDYVQWRNFDNAINKAMISCENNGNVAEDHFSRINNTIEVGNGALREVEDYMLTRYACYLIAENGDPRKEQIAFAQSYFAVQTRKQELIEERISYISEHVFLKKSLRYPVKLIIKSYIFHCLILSVIPNFATWQAVHLCTQNAFLACWGNAPIP